MRERGRDARFGLADRLVRATLAAAVALAAREVLAIETDQYYAWSRPLRDSADVLNARVNQEMEEAVAEANAREPGRPVSCDAIVRDVVSRFRFVILWEPELWAMNTSLVDRVPATPDEERSYRRRYVYAETSPADTIRRMPPAPTIEIDGVRLGTDKLTHFFSEGWFYHRWYLKYLARGATVEEAERKTIRRGVLMERTVLGMTSSGVFSPADLEANYEGMLFWNGFCGGTEPALRKTPEGWRLVRPLDLREHVSPRWDESWQPNVYGKRRWRKVLPALREYCPMLIRDPEIRARRLEYALRDHDTPTQAVIREMVSEGKLTDPERFSIDRACSEEVAGPASSSRPAGEGTAR